jgi:O-antigen ligase
LSIYGSFLFFLCDTLFVFLSGNLLSIDLGQGRFSYSLGPSAGAVYLLAICLAHLGLPRSLPEFIHNFVTILIIALIVLTSTRIALFALAVSYFYMYRFSIFKFNESVLISLAKICFMIFTLLYGSLIFYNRLFFGETGSGINSNGRFEIWSTMFNAAVERIYFGHGWGASTTYLTSSGVGDGFGIQPHSDYLRILFDTGAVGLLVFFLLIIKLWFALSRTSSTCTRVAKAYILCLLILMVTDNVFIYHFFIYPALFFISLVLTKSLRSQTANESGNSN